MQAEAEAKEKKSDRKWEERQFTQAGNLQKQTQTIWEETNTNIKLKLKT